MYVQNALKTGNRPQPHMVDRSERDDIMKKKPLKIVLVALCICFIFGLVLIFSAPDRGLGMASNIVRSHGGMDTEQFLKIVEGTIASHQIGGFIISLISGIGLLISGFILYKEI